MPPTHPTQADVAAAYRTLIAHETEPKEQDFYRTRLQRLEQTTEPESDDFVTQLAVKQIEGEAAWWRSIDFDRNASRTFESMTGDSQQAVRTGVERVLALLTAAGRLIPAGGMALTAEQVTDVQILVASAHKSGIGANAADRLQGKFGSATLGSDSYSHHRALGSVSGPGSAPTEPGPEVFSLTAEQVENVRAAREELRGYRNFTGYGRSHVNRLIAAVDALFPATEPAEDAKPCGSNSVTLGWCKLTARHEGLHTNGTYLWGTPSEPDPPAPSEPAEERCQSVSIFRERCALVPGHDGRHAANGCAWGYPPAPAEPAEEAPNLAAVAQEPRRFNPADECQNDSHDPGCMCGAQHWMTASAPAEPAEEETKAEPSTRQIADVIVEGRSQNMSWMQIAEMVKQVFFPTETGPWQDWPSLDAIPADVRTVWDKAGDEYRRTNGGWKFRSYGEKWTKITLPLDDYIDYAPFTTAAVAVWDPELGTRNDWTLNEGTEQ